MGSEATPLEASLAKLASAAELLGLADVAGQVGEAARRLAGLELEVAVVGEFKRGKSTLLNALIGVEVLPAGVLPLTAVPTVLERGEPVCRVTFTDGHTEEHDLGAVAEFVTEEHNPGNRLGVQRVVVRLHAPLLDEGVRLVDTPGVGSVLEHNTRATDAYLPSLDAAILVTSADPPISRGERAFLGRVAEQAVRLFVVLNKADYLSGEELRRTVEITRRRGAFERAAAALAEEHAADEALLEAAVRRAMAALDQTLEPHRAALRSQAARATVEAAERHPELGPPALLERLAGPLLDRAEAAALAAYANAIGPVVDRAGARLAQLHQEAASAFEVCLPAFTPPEVDTTVGS